jgi:hypothetical protein
MRFHHVDGLLHEGGTSPAVFLGPSQSQQSGGTELLLPLQTDRCSIILRQGAQTRLAPLGLKILLEPGTDFLAERFFIRRQLQIHGLVLSRILTMVKGHYSSVKENTIYRRYRWTVADQRKGGLVAGFAAPRKNY